MTHAAMSTEPLSPDQIKARAPLPDSRLAYLRQMAPLVLPSDTLWPDWVVSLIDEVRTLRAQVAPARRGREWRALRSRFPLATPTEVLGIVCGATKDDALEAAKAEFGNAVVVEPIPVTAKPTEARRGAR
jgi:hypothetical protein